MPAFHTVLIADDEPSLRNVLTLALTDAGFEVRSVTNGEEALKELRARPYDVLVTDVRMPRLSGLELLKQVKSEFHDLIVVVMSAYGTREQALEAVQLGANDYLAKPFAPDELIFVLDKVGHSIQLERDNQRLRQERGVYAPLERLAGKSPQIEQLKKGIHRVAKSNAPILIQGESGTGKELVARGVHELSLRSKEPFVSVNCGAIPEGLIEAELFGHARGAFTDAKMAKRGLISEASGGTLFLDEIGELPPQMQVKLLRFLQESEIRPLGETRSIKVDVRVVAATNRDLRQMVKAGTFREDLYFRLNVVLLEVPPLRERVEDIPIIVERLIQDLQSRNRIDRSIRGLSAEAMHYVTTYQWPGNVRELENGIERAALMTDGMWIDAKALPERITHDEMKEPVMNTGEFLALSDDSPGVPELSLKRAIAQLEEKFIREALRRTEGNRAKAASLLDISARALQYKLKDYSIDADRP